MSSTTRRWSRHYLPLRLFFARSGAICCHAASVRPTRLRGGPLDLGLAVSLRKIVAAFLEFLARDVFDVRRYKPGVPERVGEPRAAVPVGGPVCRLFYRGRSSL